MTLIKAYYEWDKDFISENRCINTDITSIQCYGKCFLDKNMEQAQKAGDKDQKSIILSVLNLEYLSTSFKIEVMLPESETEHVYCLVREKLLEGVSFPEHLPPSC